MKKTFLFYLIGLAAITFSGCKIDNIDTGQQITSTPPVTGKSDTSKTLIGNTSLVGDWSIVTDTISFISNVMYQGQPGDHYQFTKYGNVYIHSAFQSYIDTGIYSITPNSRVQWTNSFISVNGVASRTTSITGPYVITNLTDSTLTLTQLTNTSQGRRYEQIIFAKKP
ncbi:MAG: hypothetical protein ACTHJ8_20615 [Mucilaginibacter sp.]